MTIETDVQLLDPGALLAFFTLDASALGGGVLRFHGIRGSGNVTWQGNVFSPWPIAAEGFARTSDQQPTPKLRVGNIDGSISLLCLAYDDLVGMKLTRQRTFVKYIDAVNFPGGVNPTADPTEEFPPETWLVERKSAENREAVEFELASALDFNGIRLPRRQIIAGFCNFDYRGPYCNYTGPAVAQADDTPTTSLSLDRCGKRLSSCRLRQWPDKVLNFGGFPAAGLLRT